VAQEGGENDQASTSVPWSSSRISTFKSSIALKINYKIDNWYVTRYCVKEGTGSSLRLSKALTTAAVPPTPDFPQCIGLAVRGFPNHGAFRSAVDVQLFQWWGIYKSILISYK
jgi:hypothetical protein